MGFGHSSRALLIARHLKKKGHNVKIITYGDGLRALKNEFDCLEVTGLNLIFRNGNIDTWATVLDNVKFVPGNILKSKKIRETIEDFSPNFCISDMEPITCFLSRLYGFPLISIDNQHALTNLKMKVPWKYKKDAFIARRVIRQMIGNVDRYIVSSFYDSSVKKKNTVIIPPIVREDVQKIKQKNKGKILVYMSKSEEASLDCLRSLKEDFVVYGFDIKKKVGNLEFRKRKTFLRDLGECSCVIGTAGFSLISEAVYLNKPYLAVPLSGQFEQVANALFLNEAGFGDYCEKLNEKDVGYFLYRLEEFRARLKKYNPRQDKVYAAVDKAIGELG